MNATNYQVIGEETIEKLMDRVNDEIRKGWQPIGGVNCTYVPLPTIPPADTVTMFHQAMIK